MSKIVGWRRGEYRELVNLMDKIGWRCFMEGMILKEIVVIQSKGMDNWWCRLTVGSWSAGLVTKLLEVTCGLWLYRNVYVHDAFSGENVLNRKEGMQQEVEYQIALGGEGSAEKDQYMPEINLDDLDHSTGKDQIYWLLALKTARRAWQLCEAWVNTLVDGGRA